MVEWYNKVGVGDGSDKYRVFNDREKRMKLVIVDGDVNRQDSVDFYGTWRGSNRYRRRWWNRNG